MRKCGEGINYLNNGANSASYTAVRHHSPFMRFLLLLCGCAVFAAQVFGVNRGYLCECHGEAEIVSEESCAESHDDCHSDDAEPTPVGHDDEREHHAEIDDDLKGRTTADTSANVPAPVMIEWTSDFTFVSSRALAASREPLWGECHAPPGAVLARTFVLRI